MMVGILALSFVACSDSDVNKNEVDKNVEIEVVDNNELTNELSNNDSEVTTDISVDTSDVSVENVVEEELNKNDESFDIAYDLMTQEGIEKDESIVTIITNGEEKYYIYFNGDFENIDKKDYDHIIDEEFYEQYYIITTETATIDKISVNEEKVAENANTEVNNTVRTMFSGNEKKAYNYNDYGLKGLYFNFEDERTVFINTYNSEIMFGYYQSEGHTSNYVSEEYKNGVLTLTYDNGNSDIIEIINAETIKVNDVLYYFVASEENYEYTQIHFNAWIYDYMLGDAGVYTFDFTGIKNHEGWFRMGNVFPTNEIINLDKIYYNRVKTEMKNGMIHKMYYSDSELLLTLFKEGKNMKFDNTKLISEEYQWKYQGYLTDIDIN